MRPPGRPRAGFLWLPPDRRQPIAPAQSLARRRTAQASPACRPPPIWPPLGSPRLPRHGPVALPLPRFWRVQCHAAPDRAWRRWPCRSPAPASPLPQQRRRLSDSNGDVGKKHGASVGVPAVDLLRGVLEAGCSARRIACRGLCHADALECLRALQGRGELGSDADGNVGIPRLQFRGDDAIPTGLIARSEGGPCLHPR